VRTLLVTGAAPALQDDVAAVIGEKRQPIWKAL